MPINKKEVQFPYLLECCKFTKNMFWENIFENLAYGISPYGTYISKGFLCCSYKKKEFSYKLERKDIEIAYNDIHELLSEKLGILSHMETMQKKLTLFELEKNQTIHLKWSDIRKKNTKELHIELYICRMRHKYSLSIEQSKYLLYMLYISIAFKLILPTDINYKNERIININGITFSKNKIHFDNDIYKNTEGEISYDKKKSEIKNESLSSMSEYWDKYIDGLHKINSIV